MNKAQFPPGLQIMMGGMIFMCEAHIIRRG